MSGQKKTEMGRKVKEEEGLRLITPKEVHGLLVESGILGMINHAFLHPHGISLAGFVVSDGMSPLHLVKHPHGISFTEETVKEFTRKYDAFLTKELKKQKQQLVEDDDSLELSSVEDIDDDSDLPLDPRVLEHYTPPFSYDENGGYVFDANGNMIADSRGDDGKLLRRRGWGRTQYLHDADFVHIEVGRHMAKALTDYWEKHHQRVEEKSHKAKE